MNINRSELGYMTQFCTKFEKEKIMPTLSSSNKKLFKESKAIYKYPSLVILGKFLGGVLGRRRIELHSAMIEHSGIDEIVKDAEKKTICFTNYVDTVDVADRYFTSRGFKTLKVYAETNTNVNGILNEFRENIEINPLLATIQSLSTGVTLICANTCIFLNQPFRSADYEQASNRVFRIGQTAQVYFYDLILDTGTTPNLSTRLMDIQQWSQQQVEIMLNKDMGKVDLNEKDTLAADLDEDTEVPSIEHLEEGILTAEEYIALYVEDVVEVIPSDKLTALNWE